MSSAALASGFPSCRLPHSAGSVSCCRRSPSSGTRSTRATRGRRSPQCSRRSVTRRESTCSRCICSTSPMRSTRLRSSAMSRRRPCSLSPRRRGLCCRACELASAGVPVLPTPSDARGQWRRSCVTLPRERGGRRDAARPAASVVRACGEWDEDLAKRLVAEAGLAAPARIVCSTHDEAFAALGQLRPPLVVKILDPAIEHKTEARRGQARDPRRARARRGAGRDRCPRARGAPVPDRGDGRTGARVDPRRPPRSGVRPDRGARDGRNGGRGAR